MAKFVENPNITLYDGIIVKKNTKLTYKRKNVKQTLENLVFRSITKNKGDNYSSTLDTTIKLNEGDVLIFDGEERGYVFPVNKFVTVDEAVDDLKCIADIK